MHAFQDPTLFVVFLKNIPLVICLDFQVALNAGNRHLNDDFEEVLLIFQPKERSSPLAWLQFTATMAS